MKARRHQPRAGEDEEEGQRNASSNEVRYGEKGPLWFPVALGALFLVMVGVLLCLTPQTKQHAWLTLHTKPTPPPTENMYLKRPLQQVPNLPPGPENSPTYVKERGATTRLHCETTAGPLTIDIHGNHPPTP